MGMYLGEIRDTPKTNTQKFEDGTLPNGLYWVLVASHLVWWPLYCVDGEVQSNNMYAPSVDYKEIGDLCCYFEYTKMKLRLQELGEEL